MAHTTAPVPGRKWLFFPKAGSLSIAAKLALVITAVIIIGMGLLSLFILSNQSKIFSQQTESYAAALGNQLSAAALEPLLAGDIQAIEQLTFNLADNEGIEGVAIFSDQSTMLSTIGIIPEQDPAQILQHQPLQWSIGEDRQIGLISYINTIKFRELNAGYYIITFDRSFMDTAYSDTIRTIFSITIFMVALGIVVAFFISKRISRPIEELVDGSRQISQGNHQFRFNEGRTDELGQLMGSLNTMTEGLLRKEQVEQTFSRYVSPSVAGTIMDDLEKSRLGGTHVEATVLFADISGFTSISEGLAPVTINNLLNDYFTLIDQIAGKHGGHIDKYIGDCAMILFGAPLQDEKHGLNAVKCAVEIQHLIQEFNRTRRQQKMVTVEFSIGINSGTMLAGNMGSENRMEYTVVGNSVNLASRLSSVARAGQIIVTKKLHDTLSLETFFATCQSNTIKLRGKSEAVEIWQVKGYLNMADSSTVVIDLPPNMIH
jgi:adenylate cyclase